MCHGVKPPTKTPRPPAPSSSIYNSREYKEVPCTIEMSPNEMAVWLNLPLSKERIVLTENDSKSIAASFKLLKAMRKGGS